MAYAALGHAQTFSEFELVELVFTLVARKKFVPVFHGGEQYGLHLPHQYTS